MPLASGTHNRSTSLGCNHALGMPCRLRWRWAAAATRSRTTALQSPSTARSIGVGSASAASAGTSVRRCVPDSAQSGLACTGICRCNGPENRTGTDSSPRRTGSGPGRLPVGLPAKCGSVPIRAARAILRALCDPTPEVRRGTARRDAQVKSRPAAGRCLRPPAPRPMRCDAARDRAGAANARVESFL